MRKSKQDVRIEEAMQQLEDEIVEDVRIRECHSKINEAMRDPLNPDSDTIIYKENKKLFNNYAEKGRKKQG